MFNRWIKALITGSGLLALAGCASLSQSDRTAPTFDTANAAQIFLVRHAEKMAGPDPDLTVMGQARATALADLLIDAEITRIYSSDYNRTRQTAAPLADALGMKVALYDPRDLSGFASTLTEMTGHILVVGHSNTTPQLTELLGGDGGSDIVEATEYDRLYIVTQGQGGSVETILLRYGDRSARSLSRTYE